jgi:hypothetical protein
MGACSTKREILQQNPYANRDQNQRPEQSDSHMDESELAQKQN